MQAAQVQRCGTRGVHSAPRHSLRAGSRMVMQPARAVSSDKADLLAAIAGIDRGALANAQQARDIATAIKRLEDASPLSTKDSTAIETALNGKWQLIYTDVEQFRSSPFFWAFEGLVGNVEVAKQIFAFTDAIPGATVGQAFQTLDLVKGSLVSEVDLEVFPKIKGTVVTTSTVSLGMPPTTLVVTVDSTRVAGSNLLPQIIDAVSVPVKELAERVKGSGATTVTAQITYLDASLRVTRVTSDGSVFVYRRVTE